MKLNEKHVSPVKVSSNITNIGTSLLEKQKKAFLMKRQKEEAKAKMESSETVSDSSQIPSVELIETAHIYEPFLWWS